VNAAESTVAYFLFPFLTCGKRKEKKREEGGGKWKEKKGKKIRPQAVVPGTSPFPFFSQGNKEGKKKRGEKGKKIREPAKQITTYVLSFLSIIKRRKGRRRGKETHNELSLLSFPGGKRKGIGKEEKKKRERRKDPERGQRAFYDIFFLFKGVIEGKEKEEKRKKKRVDAGGPPGFGTYLSRKRRNKKKREEKNDCRRCGFPRFRRGKERGEKRGGNPTRIISKKKGEKGRKKALTPYV